MRSLVCNLISLSRDEPLKILCLETKLEGSSLGCGSIEIKSISQKKASFPTFGERFGTHSLCALMEVSESIKVRLFIWFISNKEDRRIFKIERLHIIMKGILESICFVFEKVRKNDKKIFKRINRNKILKNVVIDKLKCKGDFNRRF